MKYLLAVGMFRSGTTFLGRVLDAHPRIVAASDPYFEFFKAFRNEIYREHFPDWDDTEPFDDYFCTTNTEIFNQIQAADFDRPIKRQSLDTIIQHITAHGGQQASTVMSHIQDVKANTYKELWIELVKKLEEVYSQSPDSVIGCKETWPEEMIAPFIRTFPKSKCVHILRDPRAVIASNFTQKSSYCEVSTAFFNTSMEEIRCFLFIEPG